MEAGDSEELVGSLSDKEIILADRYRILPESPLPELGTVGAKAYVVRDLKNPNDMLFARMCEPSTFPRVEVMVQLKNLRDAFALIPEDWGPVWWPPIGKQSFAIVFRRPETGPLMPSMKSKIQKLDGDTVIKSLLTPALKTLTLFERRKITHRAIRPDNIFATGIDGKVLILGDCVSVPPSFGQPTIFETIEKSMTPAAGRGKGTVMDDIYALGATMLFLAIGHCPVIDKSERDLLKAKIDQGSFIALLNGETLPGGLREPIRGMLNDDVFDRWTLDDIIQWTNGTLRRSARAVRDFKTDRPFKFRDREFRNTRLLAASFGANWEDAAEAMKTKLFDNWIQRGIQDAALVENVSEAVESAGGSEADTAKLVTRVCTWFDPDAPIRYKGFISMPDGMGHSYAMAVEEKDKITIGLLTEMIQKKTAIDWFEQKLESGRADLTIESKLFTRLQQFLRHAGPGYGMERVLYELNQFLPCRSPMLSSAYVYSLRDLLPALDAIVAQKGSLPALVDRHVAAFIASRIGGGVETQLSALEHTAGASANAKIGMTGLLAKVQYEYQDQLVPNLTAWLADDLAGAVDRFQSRSMRKRIAEKLDEVATSGNLVALYQALANKNALKKDERGQGLAKREYNDATREIKRLESAEFQQAAKRTGWRIAAGISIGIGVMTTIGVFTW